MKRLIAFIIILVLPVSALAADYPARVVGVTDGDTLTVLTAGKKQVKIRLHGIDAPETGQDYGQRAKQAASELAFGKEVTIRPVDTDRYERTVAEVILPDGKSLNREMVAQGAAW
jgi:micrococcal nuclease